VLTSELKVHRPGGSACGAPQAEESKLLLVGASDWKVNLSGAASPQ